MNCFPTCRKLMPRRKSELIAPMIKKAEVVERIKRHFRNRPGIVEIDGIRIPFEDGWALVRSSNTQPVIVLRFEASSEESLQRIRNEVEPLLAILQPESRSSPEYRGWRLHHHA